MSPSDSRPLLVTSALPYANGPLHFGHITGAYLPADIFVRYHRLKGTDVVFICGTDEHGVAITRKAEEEGKPYQDYVDHWHRVIKDFFDRLNIRFDNFSQTSRKDPHYPVSQEFFNRLEATDHLEEATQSQHFCPRCQRFLPDRFVEGTCYICHAPKARGDECKKCGTWLEAIQLQDPRCASCKSTPEIREARQWMLKLADFSVSPLITPWLEKFRAAVKTNVHSFVFTKMLDQEGLKSRAITRDLPWGVPVPSRTLRGEARLEGGEKVLYVWFDAPIGYISSTIEWARVTKKDPQLWRRYWIRKDGEEGPRLIHFIGKDNIPFHCIVFPAMLAWQRLQPGDVAGIPGPLLGPGPGESYVLPENVPANEFYNLEDRKFNTSEGWYIDIDRVLKEFDVDVIRYYLVASMPETADSSFLWREFQKCTNKDLADVVGNLASRVLGFIRNNFEGRIPLPGESLSPAAMEILAADRESLKAVGSAIEEYRFKQALKEAIEIGRRANRFVDEAKPWATRKSNPAACAQALFTSCRTLASLAVALSPFIPASARKLWAQLGIASPIEERLWDDDLSDLVRPGQTIGALEPLFTKVEDPVIEAELARLTEQARRSSGPAPGPELPAEKPELPYEDFVKLDLRVGQIVSAERIPKAAKLLKLTVDVGFTRRTIVAGIAEHYAPEALTGKRVIVLVNLKPRALRGVTSEGMLLAADFSGRPYLLSSDGEPPLGSPVK